MYLFGYFFRFFLNVLLYFFCSFFKFGYRKDADVKKYEKKKKKKPMFACIFDSRNIYK